MASVNHSSHLLIFLTESSCVGRAGYWLMQLTVLLEILQTKLVEKFTGILSHAQSLQHSHLDALKRHIAGVESALSAVSPQNDQNMFIEYNIRPFTLPADWKFEPCPTFYDTVSDKLCHWYIAKLWSRTNSTWTQHPKSSCRTKWQRAG